MKVMKVPNVLIVEDEKPIALALLTKCRQRGLTATIAYDGDEGLTRALEEKPDIILLDMIMPKTNGIQFLKEIRTTHWGATVPIIVLTNVAADSKEMIKAVIENTPEYYLIKNDWRLDDIADKIWEVLDPEGIH